MRDQPQYSIHLLDRSFDRSDFDCGNGILNDFIKTKASQYQKKRVAQVFVAVESSDSSKKVIGFYTTSAADIEVADDLDPEFTRKLPRHPVPVARIGRLAVCSSAKGKGLGSLLIADALKRIKSVAQEIAIYAVVVDAKDEKAKSFYKRLGFETFVDRPLTLFYLISSIPD